MDKPRYAQPFTLAEAICLDVSTINEEITRLQNSLQHLRYTQEVLHDHVTSSEPDVEIAKAIQENEVVIGSQEERIGILNLALTEKGVPTSHHYDLMPIGSADARKPGETDVHPVHRASGMAVTSISEPEHEDGDGIHL